VMTMDGPTMSGWEKRILAEIEQDLSADTRLDRELRTMRFGLLNRAGDALAAIAKLRAAPALAVAAGPAALVLLTVLVGLPVFWLMVAVVWVALGCCLLLRRA
jgi:hypothetical protein